MEGKSFYVIENFAVNSRYSSEVFALMSRSDLKISDSISEINESPDYNIEEKNDMIKEREKEVYKQYYQDSMIRNLDNDTIEKAILERTRDVIAMMEL